MNNFETLEHLWRQQAVVVSADPQKIRRVQSAAERIVSSRGRVLRWGAALTAFSIVVIPLLTVVNFVYGGRTPNLLGLVHFGALQVFQIGLFIVLLRRIRAHRRLRALGATTVRESLGASLETIESEMQEYRFGIPAFVLLLLFAAIPLLNGYQQGYCDGAGLRHRLTFLVGFGLLLLTTALRHYRRVLQPRRHELAATLAELRTE